MQVGARCQHKQTMCKSLYIRRILNLVIHTLVIQYKTGQHSIQSLRTLKRCKPLSLHASTLGPTLCNPVQKGTAQHSTEQYPTKQYDSGATQLIPLCCSILEHLNNAHCIPPEHPSDVFPGLGKRALLQRSLRRVTVLLFHCVPVSLCH